MVQYLRRVIITSVIGGGVNRPLQLSESDAPWECMTKEPLGPSWLQSVCVCLCLHALSMCTDRRV